MSKILLTILISLPFLSSAETHGDKHWFAPKNKFKIPVGAENANPMTEAQFNKILDLVYKHYEPKFSARGKTFIIERAWSDGTVNAYALQRGNNWIIKMFGGLARHKEATMDGFAAVACHEIGHHLGGAPKYMGWASNEGQSDYFATLKCARFIWKSQNNFKLMKKRMQRKGMVNDTAKAACIKAHKTRQAEALCMRSSMAGMSLARLLATLGRSPMPKFETPDASKVTRTNNRHPKAQCRLDTYFAGAVCGMDHNDEVSDSDPDVGVCSRKFNTTHGVRPRCWYKPTVADLRGSRLL